MRVLLDVLAIEFHEGGNTIWVHGKDGGTVIRIKCTGKIVVNRCTAPGPHADALVQGDIDFCVPESGDDVGDGEETEENVRVH